MQLLAQRMAGLTVTALDKCTREWQILSRGWGTTYSPALHRRRLSPNLHRRRLEMQSAALILLTVFSFGLNAFQWKGIKTLIMMGCDWQGLRNYQLSYTTERQR